MDINDQATSLKNFLKAQQPGWVVTRNLNTLTDPDAGTKPILTIIVGSGRAQGIGSFAQAPTDDVTLLLVGQQNLTCENLSGEEIEQIELGIRSAVISAFSSPDLPPDIAGIFVKNWSTSGQLNKERAEILLTASLRE